MEMNIHQYSTIMLIPTSGMKQSCTKGQDPSAYMFYLKLEKNPVFSMWCVINYIVLLMYKIICI